MKNGPSGLSHLKNGIETLELKGEERFVPTDHRDSNFRMAREALIDHAPIPASHPIPTNSASPEEAAALYEATLQGFYRSKMTCH
jgi:6-phosphogluconolactonase/glucosamine-6-phosphate isomerase/deaminase